MTAIDLLHLVRSAQALVPPPPSFSAPDSLTPDEAIEAVQAAVPPGWMVTPAPVPAPVPAAPPPAIGEPPALPPMATGYRGAPTVLTSTVVPVPSKVPRASWWRRVKAWAGGLTVRLDIRGRRRAYHWYYREATWEQCQMAAHLERNAEVHDVGARISAELELEELLKQMGPGGIPIPLDVTPLSAQQLGVAILK